MDLKKLEKLENIRNFLENDNIPGLKRYIEKIQPLVKNDEDFEEVFEELSSKNYDRALHITEDIIFDLKGQSRDDDTETFSDLEEFDEDDDFMYNDKDGDFEDLGLDSLEGDNFFEDQDDDYY